MDKTDKPASAWLYLLGGVFLGYAVGLMTAPARPEEDESEGLGARTLKRIPGKIKFAGALGAIKGAGGEAYREIKSRIEKRRHPRENGHGEDL